jgi:hypothetical protein
VNDLFAYFTFLLYLCSKFVAKEVYMTALQLNAELFRNLSVIAENETMMEKVAKYVRKVAKQLTDDPTCMTKEEFFARIDRAEQQYARGEYTTQLPGESLEDMLKRCGYVV